MQLSAERYHPRIDNAVLGPFEPYISYEHWHRYRYAASLVAGKDVLDVASGEGYGSAFLAESAASVCGVDLDPSAVDHARAAYPRANLRFLRGSAAELPLAGEGLFDVVTSFETIEHLTQEDQGRFLAEVRRVLRPGGVFLVSTPNRLTYTTGGEADHNPFHLHELTAEEFVEALRPHFGSVRLLAQHVYPVSYIWSPDGPPTPLAEYQMALGADAVFRPATAADRALGYLIAVCGDAEAPPPAPDSLLLDLSEVAFRGIPGHVEPRPTALFLDTGRGFRAEEQVGAEARYAPDFSVTFELPDAAVLQLRWDPLEGRFSRVRIDRARWTDGQGAVHDLDPAAFASNGTTVGPGEFDLPTLDPMVFLPVVGRPRSVTIEGSCTIASADATVVGMYHVAVGLEQNILTLSDALGAARWELKGAYGELTTQTEAVAGLTAGLAAAAEREVRQSARLADRDRLIAELRAELAAGEREAGRLEGRVRDLTGKVLAARQRAAHLKEQLRAATVEFTPAR